MNDDDRDDEEDDNDDVDDDDEEEDDRNRQNIQAGTIPGRSPNDWRSQARPLCLLIEITQLAN